MLKSKNTPVQYFVKALFFNTLNVNKNTPFIFTPRRILPYFHFHHIRLAGKKHIFLNKLNY